MQEKDCIVLVQTDLLLREKGIKALRERISNLKEIQSLTEFVFDSEDEKVITIRHMQLCPSHPNFDFIRVKVKDEYVLMNLENLKKFLSL